MITKAELVAMDESWIHILANEEAEKEYKAACTSKYILLKEGGWVSGCTIMGFGSIKEVDAELRKTERMLSRGRYRHHPTKLVNAADKTYHLIDTTQTYSCKVERQVRGKK